MYHLTTSTGLDISAADPAIATAALRTELDQHLAAGPVRWNVAVDGLPGRHMGQISVPEVQSPDPIEFIDDLVATVLDNLTADCRPTLS